jgi:DNA-binding XRE family transcriptional regulator
MKPKNEEILETALEIADKSKARGYLIAYYRRLCKLTQKELGTKLGLSDKAISAWESGRNEPNMGQAGELAKIFDIDVSQLMFAPPSLEAKKLEDEEVLKHYQQADDLTKQMVRKLLGMNY